MRDGTKILLAMLFVNVFYTGLFIVEISAIKKWVHQGKDKNEMKPILSERMLLLLIIMLASILLSSMLFSAYFSTETDLLGKISYSIYYLLPFPYSMLNVIAIVLIIKCICDKKMELVID
mgnify:CR=1 FL=1